MKVRDVMSAPVVQVKASDSVRQAAELMAKNRTGALVVVDSNGNIAGVVTDRDLVTECIAVGQNADSFQVGNCVASDYANMQHPTTVKPDMEIEDAIHVMEDSGVHRLPVTEDGLKALGMLSFDEIAADVQHYLNHFLSVAGRYHRH
jgi:CBS domain-containing protein